MGTTSVWSSAQLSVKSMMSEPSTSDAFTGGRIAGIVGGVPPEAMEGDPMRKKRDIEVEDGAEFTAKTIVGGRPMARRKMRMNIHAGIEKALYKAAVDPGFRRALLEDRIEAVRRGGIALTGAEEAILGSVPRERIELMIDRIRPEKHGKRRFMKAVAAAVVTLATGTAGIACEDKGGHDATDAGDVPVDTPVMDPTGDAADLPDEVEVDVPFDGVEGIMPDAPEDPVEDGDEDGADYAPDDEVEEEDA